MAHQVRADLKGAFGLSQRIVTGVVVVLVWWLMHSTVLLLHKQNLLLILSAIIQHFIKL